jgi:hypothetical protein
MFIWIGALWLALISVMGAPYYDTLFVSRSPGTVQNLTS